MSDYCPFEPSEPRCRECRGIPCGDVDVPLTDWRDPVPPTPVTDAEIAALPILDLDDFHVLGR